MPSTVFDLPAGSDANGNASSDRRHRSCAAMAGDGFRANDGCVVERDRSGGYFSVLPQLRGAVVSNTAGKRVAVGDVGYEICAGEGGVAALESEVKHGQLTSNNPETIVIVAPSGKALPVPS